MLRILVEEDRVLRLIQVILDPATSPERLAAFADFNSTDQNDFHGWLKQLRLSLDKMYPAQVELIQTQEQLQQHLPQADVVIVESLMLGHGELAMAKKSLVVYKFGTHLDNIDQQAFAQRKIPFTALRRRTNMAMAEHTMMCVLALAKRLPLINGLVTRERLAAAGYDFRPYDTKHTAGANFARVPQLLTLRECTLGLLGFGEIGQEVAVLAKAFGMRILYHKRRPLSSVEEISAGVQYCSFEELLKESHFLSVHVPFSAETTNLIDHHELQRMPQGSFLINTSRAPIVNHDALVAALQNQHLAGAACDVHHTEPVQETEELIHMDQVIMTPHLGGGSRMNGLLDARDMLVNINQQLTQLKN